MTQDLHPVPSTGLGSWPGTDPFDACRIAFAECPELPYLPELPARGAYAGLVGRGTALLTGLAVDLQPAGWRLADASGREHRLARATLRTDLDVLEEVAQGYSGPVKLAVAGPWTLAASVERPRGDLVVADPGARRDLGQSLAEGLSETVAELRRRLPEIFPVVQLDEPLLPAVLAGSLPTASGFSRHRPVEPSEVSAVYTELVSALDLDDSAPGVLVHSPAAGVPIALLHQAGIDGVILHPDRLTVPDWDALGAAMEQGLWLGLAASPADGALTADQVAEEVLRRVRALDLDPATAARLVVTPAGGLAEVPLAAAVRALRTVRTAAGIVTEQLAA